MSAAELQRRKKESQGQKEADKRRATQRKDRMILMEEDKKKSAPSMSESEEHSAKQNLKLLANANDAMDAELDDVKHMDQMMLYAKCATIRDRQLQEKAMIQEHLREQELRLDTEMEVKRVRDIKYAEEKERVSKAERKIGAQQIITQIQEREAERTRQQEIRAQEATMMLERIKEQDQKDVEIQREKVEAGKRLLVEVGLANDASSKTKLRAKQQEIVEDQRIADYIKEKDAREHMREEEEKRVKYEKDMEVAQLRAAQEKVMDRQSAIDELRARRYQEQHEREWRHRQLTEAQKRSESQSETKIAREYQRQEKAQRMADQARQDRQEYEQVLDWNRAQAQQDSDKKQVLAGRQDQFREELLEQILTKENEKALARQKFLTEGKQIGRQMAADKRKLGAIKQQKIQMLHSAGVPEKYMADLIKHKSAI
jgi:hypothetical protein